LFNGGKINVPGVAGPIPEPPVKLAEEVKTAGLFKEQLGVELALNAQIVAVIVWRVSVAVAPPEALTPILQPISFPVPVQIGGYIVTVEVAPVVVRTEVAAVSTD
jgi:hypothetical protein